MAAVLTDYFTKSVTLFKNAGQSVGFQDLQKEVVIVPEPISNTLLISATQPYFDEIMRLIAQVDVMPPQVVIQVLVAEVDLTGSEEFGVEIGLQSPLLFRRGIFPADAFLGGATTSIVGQATGPTLVPVGTTVNSSNPVGQPGFNFGNSALPLGNNPTVAESKVGFQGLNSLGVGRVSPTSNIGGFVFSAASESVNVLVRALRIQGRVQILSRPQITAMDNQIAYINVGKEVPIVTSTTVTATGLVQQNIDRRNVGVLLQVTPKITPDGQVQMRIKPEVSSVDPVPVNLGNGNVGTALNVQQLETTVAANDGETVGLGGLITKIDSKNENKIPWFGDLPGVGAMFRYRTHAKSKTELLIIMTPHIVRTADERQQVLCDEMKRMDWILSDVYKVHGHLPPCAQIEQPCVNCAPTPPCPPVQADRPGPFRRMGKAVMQPIRRVILRRSNEVDQVASAKPTPPPSWVDQVEPGNPVAPSTPTGPFPMAMPPAPYQAMPGTPGVPQVVPPTLVPGQVPGMPVPGVPPGAPIPGAIPGPIPQGTPGGPPVVPQGYFVPIPAPPTPFTPPPGTTPLGMAPVPRPAASLPQVNTAPPQPGPMAAPTAPLFYPQMPTLPPNVLGR